MLIALPFFKPPKEAINVSGVTLKTATVSQLDQLQAEHPKSGLFVFEMMRLFRTPDGKRVEDIDDFELAALETSKDAIPVDCYTALLELLTGHWKYILKRSECMAQSSPSSSPKYPKLPRYSFNASLVDKFASGVDLLSTSRRFRISTQRWYISYMREDPLDTVLDCCSSLEAALSLNNELRLRISLSVYHTFRRKKKKAFNLVYEMYGIRNSFIHGAKIPEVSAEQQRSYIEIVAQLLRRYVQLGEIPDSNVINEMIIRHYAE
jgi:hypothetical protein